jgi:2-oxoglutarate dehydrogenase E2 component (dihydrolipoamide succinyltransferase)
MPVELKVPSVGESITEVEIGDWLKKEGDSVNRDEPVVVIETEKATLEISSPVSGRVTQSLKKKGDKASIGEVIGYIEEGAAPLKESPAPVKEESENRAKSDRPEVEPSAGTKAPEPPQAQPPHEAPEEPAIESKAAPAPSVTESSERKETILPMSPIRRKIAERLVQAQRTAALLTTFNEIDMSSLLSLRDAHQEAFRQKHGVKLGITAFFAVAAIESLKRVPPLNGEIRGENMVYRDFYDIGVAIGSGKGLVVPVLRNAERLRLAGIQKGIDDFANRASTNRLRVEELQGGTFTISNGGIYGSLLSTPIVNPPQSGVLGLHAITDRPVVREGSIVARPMMYVALTYDHRIVDGREAVTFLHHIKDLIEDPVRLLLDI